MAVVAFGTSFIRLSIAYVLLVALQISGSTNNLASSCRGVSASSMSSHGQCTVNTGQNVQWDDIPINPSWGSVLVEGYGPETTTVQMEEAEAAISISGIVQQCCVLCGV